MGMMNDTFCGNPLENMLQYSITTMAHVSTILIIDDDKDFAEVLAMKLGAAGFRTERAHNGEEGILKVRGMNPDLVLLDMKMPGMNGADVLATLHSDERTKNVKVVFLSSFGDPRFNFGNVDHRAAQEIGALGYLRKTDDLELLLQEIRSYIPS